MNCTHENQFTWWEYDARGIPLCLVCNDCEAAKLAQYRDDVLTDSNYQADDPFEEVV
jgi:hypothetical protein